LENLKFAKTLSLLPKLKQAGRTYNLKALFWHRMVPHQLRQWSWADGPLRQANWQIL